MAAKNTNKCWPGYEPVPGKEPHSQGSCRPKAESKSTTGEKKFRAKRKKQLEEWHDNHPAAKPQAAQHLSAPGKKKSPPKKTATAKKTASKKPAGKKAAKKR